VDFSDIEDQVCTYILSLTIIQLNIRIDLYHPISSNNIIRTQNRRFRFSSPHLRQQLATQLALATCIKLVRFILKVSFFSNELNWKCEDDGLEMDIDIY
jgi:hypothetical protein